MKTTRTLWFLGLLATTPLTVQASSLLDIYELALQNDAQLKADEAAYEAGLENRTLGRSALLPQINARAFYETGENDTTNRINPDASGTFEQDTYGWEISLNQTLFDMSAWYEYQRGETLSDLAEVRFGADQQALIVRVAEAYFNVLRAIDTLESAQAEEKALEQQLEQTQQRYEVGLTAITEVHEARSVYDTAAATALQAKGDLGIAYEALEVLTGRSHDRIAPLSDDFNVVTPQPSDRHAWVEFALENNYELQAARLNKRATEQTSKSARSQHLPTLTGSATYRETERDGTQYFGQPVVSDERTEGHTFGVTLNVPLFSGGATSASRRQAHAEYLQSRAEENRTQRNVVQSARSLHLSVEIGVSQVRARELAIVSAESALEATQSGYEVGTRNLVEVLLAQRAVYQAQRDYYNALYDYVINSFQLREVAGMLTPADVQSINTSLDASRPVRRSDFEEQ